MAIFKRKMFSQDKTTHQYVQLSQEEGPSDKEYHKPSFRSLTPRYKGLAFAVIASLCQVLSSTLIKYLEEYRTAEISLYRSLIECTICLPIVVFHRVEFVFVPFATLLIVRSLLVSSRFLLRIFAIQSLPLADSNVILFSNPVFVAIIARLVLKDRFTNAFFVSFAINLVGVVLAARLWSSGRVPGVGAALFAILIQAFSQVVLKKLTKTLDPLLVVFHMTWMRCLLVSSLLVAQTQLVLPNIPKCSTSFFFSEPVLFISLGLSTLGFQTFNAKAVKLETPSTVAAVTTSVVLPSYFLIQLWGFHNEPSIFTILGGVLVLLGSLLLSLATIVEKLPSTSKAKQILNFLNN